MNNRKKNVLFLCTGNSCRSQMAEGWARALLGAAIIPYSAGILASGLNPLAVKVMAEAGVDITNQQSKTLMQLMNIPFDLVVTVCNHARESCPILPGSVKTIHRNFDDPPSLTTDLVGEEEKLAVYRRVRDELRSFVETLPDILESLGVK